MTEPLESKGKVLTASDYHCSKKRNAAMKCGLMAINNWIYLLMCTIHFYYKGRSSIWMQGVEYKLHKLN